MKRFRAFFAPWALLAAGALAFAVDAYADGEAVSSGAHAAERNGPIAAWLARISHANRDQPANQVRIEQHFSIRITAGGPMMPPDVLVNLLQDEVPPHYAERKMGKCVPWSAIEAVQGGEGNKLLLFMRDDRMVSAELEKSCEARAFYSGFLFARPADGQICVGRDVLQSRSGANCKMRRLRSLVADRHNP